MRAPPPTALVSPVCLTNCSRSSPRPDVIREAHAALRVCLQRFGAPSASFLAVPLVSLLRRQLSLPEPPAVALDPQTKKRRKPTAQDVASSAALRRQMSEKQYHEIELHLAALKSAHRNGFPRS